MSEAKKRALLTSAKVDEWNKYRKSMVEAWNTWKEEQARMTAEKTKRSGWSKIIGGIAAVATLAAVMSTGGIGTKLATWAGKSMLRGTVAKAVVGGLAGLGGYAAGGLHHAMADKSDLKAQIDPTANVYKPQFGKGQAASEVAQLQGDVTLADQDIDRYLDDFFPLLEQSIGQGSEYMGSELG